jgi:arsenite-transporting ATPase
MRGSLKDLDESQKKVIMFGGKGGVGKSTSSAAAALHFSSTGKRTFLISSDPMPSLGDILEMRIGPKERKVRGVENLYAVEINYDDVLKRWKEKFGSEVYEVLSSFFLVEPDIIDYIGRAPGIDEEFMIDYIVGLVEEERFDMIVWDTAPAGHTIRLLKLPIQFINHLNAAARTYLSLQGYFNRVRDAAGIKTPSRSPLEVIKKWKALATKVVDFLSDQTKVEFIVVTVPEALCVYQTKRLIDEFDRYGLGIHHLVINHVIKDPDCVFHNKRMLMQTKYLNALERRYSKRAEIIKIPEYPIEINGIESLNGIERYLFNPT